MAANTRTNTVPTKTNPPAKKTAAPAPTPRTRKRAAKKTDRAPLPTRTNTARGAWMTDIQGYATLQGLLVDITTPNIQAWNDDGDGTATRPHNDGLLHYQHQPRQLTWIALCPQGTHHTYELAAPGDLQAAERHLGWCRDPHKKPSDVQTLAKAHALARVLGDDLAHSTNAAAETQPLTRDQIDAGLADRAREHPDQDPE